MSGRRKIRWKVLIADDDSLDLGWVEQRLKADGYDVVTASSASEALTLLQDAEPQGVREILPRSRPDLAILDLRLRREDDADVGGLEIAASVAGEIPTIIFTRHDKTELGLYHRALKGVPREHHPALLFKPGEDKADRTLSELRQTVHELLVPHVFIVHGHNLEVRKQVYEKLVTMELEAGILEKTPGVGKGILQKFCAEAVRAHFAVVIFTGDDVGVSCKTLDPRRLPKRDHEVRAAAQQLRLRARQNVLFELGYFVALLGSERVLVLYEEGVEPPSDYDGIVKIKLDERGEWKDRMEEELRHAGIARTPYRPE